MPQKYMDGDLLRQMEEILDYDFFELGIRPTYTLGNCLGIIPSQSGSGGEIITPDILYRIVYWG
jgi:hypothetical protein